MRKNRLFMIGFCLLLILILLCSSAKLWIHWNPEVGSLRERLIPPDYFTDGLQGHPFGTDALGRDVLSRLFVGGRISLRIAVIVTVISMALGALVGMVSAFYGGIIDMVLMRICDILAALPQMLMALTIIAFLGNSMGVLIFTLTVSGWVGTARLVRSAVLAMKNKEFISASRVLGASDWRIIWKELFPNTLTQLLIDASGHLGGTILVETNLSYLGLGIAPPTPTWGNMIADGRTYLSSCPWIVVFPGIALALTVLGFNFLGDGIRDVFDPKNTD